MRLGAHNLALETEAAADDYRVRSASLHPEYDDTGVIPINDIAILALDTPESGVREKPEVSPVCLPGPGEVSTHTTLQPQTECGIAGFVNIISSTDCMLSSNGMDGMCNRNYGVNKAGSSNFSKSSTATVLAMVGQGMIQNCTI